MLALGARARARPTSWIRPAGRPADTLISTRAPDFQPFRVPKFAIFSIKQQKTQKTQKTQWFSMISIKNNGNLVFFVFFVFFCIF
jgi:hypothetical protein